MIQNHNYILAIDTSCDDTAAAVVSGTTILSNVIASQTELHRPYGGVFPTVAKQAHKENIDAVVALALRRSKVLPQQLAAVAVTQGPGLAPALEVGITAAKKIAAIHNLPLIAVNHIEGHLLSPLARPKTMLEKAAHTVQFPVLSVIVSGGHTQFVAVNSFGAYRVLGTTVDDAAGECLDKVGRMLNLGYPAGPTIEQFAKLGNPKAFPFPLPMTTTNDANTSFSGLKTAARNMIEEKTKEKPLTKQEIYDFSASIQYAVFRHIIYKMNTLLSVTKYHEIWFGGGVAANMELRRMLRETAKKHGIHLRVPYTRRLCQDNAAMIGLVGAQKNDRNEFSDTEKLERTPRLELSTVS